MQGDSLYSVKWYRNGQEFYRHIPTDRPQTVVFKQPGLIVDVSTKNQEGAKLSKGNREAKFVVGDEKLTVTMV